MTKESLIFLQNYYPKNGEEFDIKKLYRFIPPFPPKSKFFIELEIYKENICVISFYPYEYKNHDNKYEIRTNKGVRIVMSVFEACMNAFNSLDGNNALVFSASNDIQKREEDNPRFSAYKLLLIKYLKNYNNYEQRASLEYNTMYFFQT